MKYHVHVHTTTYITLSVLALIVLSCKQSTNPVYDCPGSYNLPMAVGNVWRYTVVKNPSSPTDPGWLETDSVASKDSIAGKLAYTIVSVSDGSGRSDTIRRIAFLSTCDPVIYDPCDCDKWSPYGMFSTQRIGLIDSEHTVGPAMPLVDSTGATVYFHRSIAHLFYNRGTESITLLSPGSLPSLGPFNALHQCDSTIQTLSNGFKFADGRDTAATGINRWFVAGIGLVKEVGNGSIKMLYSYSIR